MEITPEMIITWLQIGDKAFILAWLGMDVRVCQNEFEQNKMTILVKWETFDMFRYCLEVQVVGGWRIWLEQDYEKYYSLMGVHDH